MSSSLPLHAQEAARPAVVQVDDNLLALYEPREFADEQGQVLRYRLLKPIDYRPSKRYPLIVFLHGAGERGDDNISQLKHGAGEMAREERRRQYPAYVLVPQCPKDQRWVDVDWSLPQSSIPAEASKSMSLVKKLIDTMCQTAGIDEQRIYLTGLSMGGYGTWDAIARYEHFFAAAAPVCGGGDPKTVSRFAQLPIWCFHGALDKTVKPTRSREMVAALKAVGSDIRYTEYPEAAHDSWTATYANPEFYDWLFQQQKP
jgi:predicted peptidase